MTDEQSTGRPVRDFPDRCAFRSAQRDDPMLGTAFPAGRLLLVEQPGPWGRLGLEQSRFDPALAKELVTRLGRQGVRVLTIRRPGRVEGLLSRRWGYVDCRAEHPRMRWGRFTEDAELLTFDPDRQDTDPGSLELAADDAPVFAVCAHSTHDACCAIRGRPVAAALEVLAPGRVWECSHVGGDRFAANVLQLPTGILYGRVPPGSAGELLTRAQQGEVVVDLLRGRAGFTPVAQAAIAAAHRHTGLLRPADIRPIRVREVGADAADVDVECAGRRVRVRVHRERTEPYRMTCQAVVDSTAIVYRPEVISAEVSGALPVG